MVHSKIMFYLLQDGYTNAYIYIYVYVRMWSIVYGVEYKIQDL